MVLVLAAVREVTQILAETVLEILAAIAEIATPADRMTPTVVKNLAGMPRVARPKKTLETRTEKVPMLRSRMR